jgi:hypothetical protein
MLKAFQRLGKVHKKKKPVTLEAKKKKKTSLSKEKSRRVRVSTGGL